MFRSRPVTGVCHVMPSVASLGRLTGRLTGSCMEGGGYRQSEEEDLQEDLALHLLTDVRCHFCAVIQPHRACVFPVK